MTRRKQGQRVLWEGMIDEDVRSLWEPWMVQANRLMDDEELIDRVYFAQGERHEHSATQGTIADACRDGAATDAAQARAQLGLRRTGARGADEPGLSRFHADRNGQGAGCENTGAHRAGTGRRSDRGTASASGGDGAGRRRDPGAQASSRYDGSRNQHSLPDRFEFAGRWCACADAHDERRSKPRRAG